MKFFCVIPLLPTVLAWVVPEGGKINIPAINKVTDGLFSVVEDPSGKRGTTVLKARTRGKNVNLYFAIDGLLQEERPGNGGFRLLTYESDEHAIDDAVRLAKGMSRKHDMFRTGFSGAKLVCKVDDISTIDRKELMEDTAKALEALNGSVYTGCDLNTGDKDMDYLTSATRNKYVLAGRNSMVDTNIATAASVIGSILGVCEAYEEDISKLTFTVQGCGKVGGIVARELLSLGAKCVNTCDIVTEAADIQGCTQIKDWSSTPCDFLVPCANSLAITESVASNFPEGIRYCVGATNSPYANSNARNIFDSRGVVHIPESISSAGAILADSVEWFDIDLYRSVEPSLLYGWIRSLSHNKARNLANEADRQATRINSSLENVIPSRNGDPIGKEFPDWILENTHKTDTLIVGGGVVGTASAFALGERGTSSILVEQGDDIAPSSGSSNGDSRMYRRMYSDEFFSKMQKVALDRWRDVEKLSNEKLLQENGLLFYGEDTGETVEGSVLGVKNTMEKLNLSHTFYSSGDEIFKAYPSLGGCKGKDYSGVSEDTAGHIRASAACKAMIKAAGDSCTVQTKTKIVSIDIDAKDRLGKRISAVTEDGKIILANNVIIAAGPWTNKMLEMAGLPSLDLKVWQVQWAHYLVEDSNLAESIPQAFHFRKENGIDGGLYYVFPSSATESIHTNDKDKKTYVKVGVDFITGKEMDDMNSFDYKGSEEVLKLMDGWVKEHLPQAGKRIDSYCSPYTMTTDSDFVMDTVADDVALFAGGNGRAFKFGPLLGDCMVSLLTDEDPPVALERFSAQRDAIRLKTFQ